jgi:hypothetical protein
LRRLVKAAIGSANRTGFTAIEGKIPVRTLEEDLVKELLWQQCPIDGEPSVRYFAHCRHTMVRSLNRVEILASCFPGRNAKAPPRRDGKPSGSRLRRGLESHQWELPE